MKIVNNISDFEQILETEKAVFAYFSHEKCSVCKTLKPKLNTTLNSIFPKINQVYIDIEKSPEIAGQYQIFTVPVILVFFEGKESIRKARNIGVDEFAQLIKRPYSLIFD